MNIGRINLKLDTMTEIPNCNEVIVRNIYDGLKPLRAACTTPDTNFLAYLIEMAQSEAYRILAICPEQFDDV